MTSDGAGRQRPHELNWHPTDQLIRDLIDTGRQATPDEITRIIERMAMAPFEPRVRSVSPEDQGIAYQGHILGERESSLSYHLVKRVIADEQWAHGTTADEYVADLRRAVRAPSAHLTVYSERGGALAAALAPTAEVVQVQRQGPRALTNVAVIYSADRGIIVTGYQFSTLDRIRIPEGARWLK